MFSKYKKILAIFGIVAFLVSTLFAVSFAGDNSKERRSDRYDKKQDRSDRYDRHDRDDSDDSGDDRDSDSDDDGMTQPPVVEPPVVEPPVVGPPALDGNQVYQENCAGCHGSGKKGDNFPTWHQGSKVNLTPAEIEAINAL